MDRTRALALALVLLVVASGCASKSTRGPRVTPPRTPTGADTGGPGGTGAPGESPFFSFIVSEFDDRLVVNNNSSAADWQRLQLSASSGEVRFALNVLATRAQGTNVTGPDAWMDVSNETDPMSVGEFIEFCGATPQWGNLTAVTVRLRDVVGGVPKGDWSFSSVAGCEPPPEAEPSPSPAPPAPR